MRLEDLHPNSTVRGVHPDGLVTVVSVQWFGSAALEHGDHVTSDQFRAGLAEVRTEMGAFPISRSRAHTHRRHGHPLQTVPSAGLIERPQEKNRVDALR